MRPGNEAGTSRAHICILECSHVTLIFASIVQCLYPVLWARHVRSRAELGCLWTLASIAFWRQNCYRAPCKASNSCELKTNCNSHYWNWTYICCCNCGVVSQWVFPIAKTSTLSTRDRGDHPYAGNRWVVSQWIFPTAKTSTLCW